MQPRLTVSVLPGVAQRLMSHSSLLRESVKTFRLPCNLTKTGVMTAPAELPLLIGHIQWCTVQIGTEPENITSFVLYFPVNMLPQPAVLRGTGLETRDLTSGVW